MPPQTQEEFDALIAAANEATASCNSSLTDTAAAVTAEAQQVADFIAAHPGIDTSALAGVVTNLQGVATQLGTVAASVSGIFTPPEA